jgi:hexosaminidase
MTFQPNVIPYPSSLSLGDGAFLFPQTLKVKGDLDGLTREWLEDLERLFGQRVRLVQANNERPDLIIDCKSREVGRPSYETIERYDLHVSPTGISIRAKSFVGVQYAFQSLLHLAECDESLSIPACDISDEPRFKWRGLMLDVARHFMPMELVKRMVDGMGRIKLNVLHFGLSNNQGFRVESKRFVRLHETASDGDYYTQDEVKDLIAYAGRRGIRIVPEFNMPGHSTAFLVAYEELASGPAPEGLHRTSGVFDDEMNPASPHTDRFVSAFIKEMAALFPDEYWHFGGDEVTGKSWDADPSVQAYMKDFGLETNHELQALFTDRVLAHLSLNGKIGIGWEEVVHGQPGTNTIIQPWISSADKPEFQDYPIIVSTGYYLDHFFKASDYFAIDPEPDGSTANIMGAEACIWSEVMNADNVEAICWPGAVALAERFWSPREGATLSTLDERLRPALERMGQLGAVDFEAPRRLATKVCSGSMARATQTLRDYTGPLVYYFALNRTQDPHNVRKPFSRLIETLVPETKAAKRFEHLVDLALSDDMKPLKEELSRLTHLGDDFARVVEGTPGLAENQPLADMLARLARAALDELEGRPHTDELPLEALEGPKTADLTGALEVVGRRRRSSLPLILKETNILILPALGLVLGR